MVSTLFPVLRRTLLLVFFMVARAGADTPAADLADSAATMSWIDPTTGHKIVRLYREAGSSSALYFHQNSFTPNGDKMIFTHNDWIYSVDWPADADPGTGEVNPVVETGGFPVIPLAGRVTRAVYFFDVKKKNLSTTDLDTRLTRVITTLPDDWDFSPDSLSGLSLSADDSLIVGAQTKGIEAIFQAAKGERQNHINAAFDSHLPTFLWTVNVQTGELKIILKGNDFFNHVQCSPTDPTLIMFCHEGPWQKLDRIWTVHTDGSGLTNVHPRKAPGDAYGHEFWSPDGKTIWSDFAEAATKLRFLVGTNLENGTDTRYPITREQFSRHYNMSRDGKIFAGDGDSSNLHPMIKLLVPQSDGTLQTEPLCDISKTDFQRKEPNVKFSPDDKWLIFSSTQTGEVQAYAVKIAKEADDARSRRDNR